MSDTTSNPKILIVDDLPANIIAMKKVLSPLKAELICAESGQQALKHILEHSFAVIFLDVQMPEMDGYETAECIRSYKKTENTPIIFVTAHNKEMSQQFEGYERGAIDYLIKPLDASILRSKAKVFLELFYEKNRDLNKVLHQLRSTQKELEKSNEELKHLSAHDDLTRLPNRRLYNKKLDEAIALYQRKNQKFALLIIDVDNFKLINDSLGHVVGDDVLKHIGATIRTLISSSDTIARIGGDEFAIILTIEHEHEAGKMASNIIEKFTTSQKINSNELQITLSIGIACFPNAAKNLDELTKNADIAMYKAKAEKPNNFHYFSDELNAEFSKRNKIELELSNAVANEQFNLVYQPIISMKTGAIIGYEALIRWEHPNSGIIPPSEFIYIAEENGLINGIGEWVIKTSIAQYAKWRKQGFTQYILTINISAKQLSELQKNKTLQKVASKHKVPLDKIHIELTETALYDPSLNFNDAINELHEAGLHISIDDFGVGYSSLIRVRDCNATTMKIDKSFVDNITSDKTSQIIIHSINELANNLNIMTICEGVETKEQQEVLLKCGCEYAQGFLYYRPLNVEQLGKVLLADSKKSQGDNNE